jgi:hypothetical protein
MLYTALKDPHIFGLLLIKMMESNEEDLKTLLWSKGFINEWLKYNKPIEIYKTMFDVLPESILKNFILSANFGLHHIAADPQLLKTYLSWYNSEEEKLAATCAADRNGRSILQYSIGDVQSFEIILALYQNNPEFMLSKEPSLLAAAVSHPEVFFQILQLLPNPESKNAALKNLFQLEESNGFWTEIRNKPEIFDRILAAYTDEEKNNILSQEKVQETIGHICSKPQTLEWFKKLLKGLSWHEAFIFLSTTTAFSENHKSLWHTIISAKPLGSGTNFLLRNFPKDTCDILVQVLFTAPYNKKKVDFLKNNRSIFKKFSLKEHAQFTQGLMKRGEYNAIAAYVKLFEINIQSKIKVISDIEPFYQHGVDNFVYPAVQNKLLEIATSDPNPFKDIIEYLNAKFLCAYIKNNILSIHADMDTIIRILSHTCKNKDDQILVVDCFSEVLKTLSLNGHIAIMNTLSESAFLHYLERHSKDIECTLIRDEDIASLFHSIKAYKSHSCSLPSRHDWLYDNLKDHLLLILSERATINLLHSKINEQREEEFLRNIASFVEKFKSTYMAHRSACSFSFFRSNFGAQLTENDAIQNNKVTR